MFTLNVNGRTHEVDVEADTPLLWVLRDGLGLTGTKYGCGIAACGACTVHLDGVAERSCVLPVEAVGEAAVTTIEGLSDDGRSHPVQRAWAEVQVPQCGYCQSGQIMAAASYLSENPDPTVEDVRENLTNLCRCGTYERIWAGVVRAAALAKG